MQKANPEYQMHYSGAVSRNIQGRSVVEEVEERSIGPGGTVGGGVDGDMEAEVTN